MSPRRKHGVPAPLTPSARREVAVFSNGGRNYAGPRRRHAGFLLCGSVPARLWSGAAMAARLAIMVVVPRFGGPLVGVLALVARVAVRAWRSRHGRRSRSVSPHCDRLCLAAATAWTAARTSRRATPSVRGPPAHAWTSHARPPTRGPPNDGPPSSAPKRGTTPMMPARQPLARPSQAGRNA